MAVLRCPHCGKPNPDFLDSCQYCEKPLKAAAAPPPASGGEGDAPDWLRGLPGEAESADIPDWLKKATSDLPAQPASAAAPAGDVPDWLKSLGGESQAAQSEDVPDWLKTSTGPISAEDTAPLGPTAPISDEPQEAVPDWLKSLGATGAVGSPTEQLDTMPLPGTAPVRDTGAFTTAESAGEGLPDWLKSLGATGGMPVPPPPSSAPPPVAPTGEMPDWLQDIPPSQSLVAPEPPPASIEPAPSADADLPDWLHTATGPLTTEFAPPLPPPSQPAEAELGDVPDWLRTATGSLSPAESVPPIQPAAPTPSSAGEDLPDWLRTATGPLTAAFPPAAFTPPSQPPEPAPSETPDWLHTAAGVVSEPVEAPSQPPSQPVEPQPPTADMPDWLRVATEPPLTSTPVVAAEGEEIPDWLRTATGSLVGKPAEPAMPEPKAPTAPLAEPEGLPDWLKAATGPLTAALTPLAFAPKETPPPAPVQPEVTGLEKGELPDWLKPMTGDLTPVAPAIETPAGQAPPVVSEPPRPTGATAPFTTPTVPISEPDWLASLRDEPEPVAEPVAVSEEPDWLSALRPEAEPVAEAIPAIPAPSAEMAQADLPSWLAAMRPVDVAPTGLDRETDDYLESVGVLGGLRGVLRAEPSVVLPGKSATNIHLLNYTDAQSRQAALFTKLVTAEAPAAAAKARRALASWPWERWLVAALLLLGMALALPFGRDAAGREITGPFGALFPLPRTAPAEVAQAFETVNTLEAGRPVLVAFDYEPGQAGEMTPLADVVVGHLIRRGLPIVAVSTQVTGAGVAEEELNRLTGAARGSINDYTRGVNYLNLGFLPGGPLGIRQLVQSPRSVARMGAPASGNLWESTALLSGVQAFNDFSAVIVLSHTPDGARAWVEQTQGTTPQLVLVTSASAAPLVRPYFEGNDARLAGFLGGPAAAMQYDTRGGSVLAVEQERAAWGRRWDMLGVGLLTVAGLLIIGNLFYGVRRALAQTRRGKAR